MPAYNRTILAGHLCADLDVRTLGETSVATARLAVDDSYKAKDGSTVERTVFVDVDIWGRQAETTAQFCRKGSPILVEGKLKMEAWDDKETGAKRTKLKIRADRVVFLGQVGGKSAADAPSEPAHVPSAKPPADEDLPF